ncbi:hypothetical protein GINT2_000380 [Glugoides intestinalis]
MDDSYEVKKILEYKNNDGRDYLLVQWNDNTTTWARPESLNCKELICSFFKNAIAILRREERSNEELEKKKKEELLFNKLITNNLKESERLEKEQQRIVSKLLEATISNSNQEKEKTPVLEFKNRQELKNDDTQSKRKKELLDKLMKSGQEIWNTPQRSKERIYSTDLINTNIKRQEIANMANIKRQEVPNMANIKRQVVTTMKNNSINIRLGQNMCLNLIFFFKNNFQPLSFDERSIVFCDYKSIFPYLYSLYYENSPNFSILPSSETEATPESPIELYMREKGLMLICKEANSFWVLSTRKGLSKIFSCLFKSKFLLFKIDELYYLNRIFFLRKNAQQETLWLSKSFRFGISMLTDVISNKYLLPKANSIFIIGNIYSTVLFHIYKFYQRNCVIVDSIVEANIVLIQESSIDFLHSTPGFYTSLMNASTRFLLLSADGINEILPGGGMLTFSDEFIRNAELLTVADTIEILVKKKAWVLKVKESSFLALKARLVSQNTMPAYLYKMKILYTAFKSNISDFSGNYFRDYLEMKYFRTHRHFIEVSLQKNGDASVTIEEARSLIIYS